MTPLEAALQYAELGWQVIPLHHAVKGACSCGQAGCKSPAKHPRTPHGLKDASSAETTIRGWWRQWPKANVGIVTGRVSGIVVLDADGPQGIKTLRDRPLGDGPVSSTGRGEHHIFAHPGGPDLGNFAKRLPGVDGRADGGYIVAPPSVHASGTVYRWIVAPWDSEPLELPEWADELFTPAGTRTAPSSRPTSSGETGPAWLEAIYQGASEGGRNDAMTRIAGHYFGLGLSLDDVLPILEAANLRFQPPLDEIEVEQVAHSIDRAQRRKAATTDPSALERLSAAGLPEDELKAVRLENISTALGVKVEQVIKYRSDPPRYALQVAGQPVPLGGVEGLIEQGRLRKAIAAGVGRLIKPQGKNEWPGLAQLLLDACEELELEEATTRGTLERWLRAYGEQWSEAQWAEPWQKLALDGHPFNHKGSVCVPSSELKTFIKTRLDENVSIADLAHVLRTCGARPDSVRATFDGKTAMVRAWRLPPDLASGSALQHDTGDTE